MNEVDEQPYSIPNPRFRETSYKKDEEQRTGNFVGGVTWDDCMQKRTTRREMLRVQEKNIVIGDQDHQRVNKGWNPHMGWEFLCCPKKSIFFFWTEWGIPVYLLEDKQEAERNMY